MLQMLELLFQMTPLTPLVWLTMNDLPQGNRSVVYHSDLKIVTERKRGPSLSRQTCSKCFQKQSPLGNARCAWSGIESNP